MGNKNTFQENLSTLVSHQFGDHLFCEGRFCGFKRNISETHPKKSFNRRLKKNKHFRGNIFL